MKKRVISIMLIGTMLLGCLSGCKAEKEDKPVSGEKVSLTVGIPQSEAVKDYDDNAFTKYIEESLNMEINFEYFASGASEYTQQLTFMCAGEEKLPDVLIGFNGLERLTANQFGEDGYFLDLTDLIEKYGTNFKKQLDKLDKKDRQVVMDRGTNTNNGAFYGMPLYASMDTPDDMQNMIVINKTWLDAVGMQAPTNIDELYQVLKAFKEQDPNKNGKNDEIPMYSYGYDGGLIWYYIMNAFVYYDGENPFNVTDGKVWDPMITDEFRQGLVYINKLVKEGLLSELSLTSNGSEQKTMVTPTDGVAKVGIWCGHPQLVTNSGSDILDEYIALAPLQDETGKGGYGVQRPRTLLYANFITKDCENTEAAMRLLDFLYNDETTTRARHGEKDVDWTVGEGTSSLGTPSTIKIINPDAGVNDSQKWQVNVGVMTNENYIAISDEEGYWGAVSRLLGEMMDVMKGFRKPEEVAVELVYTASEYDERSKINATAASYRGETINLFILGEKNPSNDSEWNEFLETLEEYGQSKLVDICQSAYDRQSK